MVYHSRWNGFEERSLLGCGVFPLNFSDAAAVPGPAPRLQDLAASEAAQDDVVDEALYYLKTNLLCRTFSIKGAGDRVILYLTVFFSECLRMIVGMRRQEAEATLRGFARNTPLPPDHPKFPFCDFFPHGEEDEVKEWVQYAGQLRMEAVVRLTTKVFAYPEEDGTGSKFWLVFAKRGFLSS